MKYINKSIKIFVLFVFIFLSFTQKTYAGVLINEVQISPAEGRFIELYNSGDSDVDLTDWYIQRKTATGADFGSLVSKTYFIGKSIKSHSFLVISRGQLGRSDIIQPALTLTESNVIQLKNSKLEVVDNVGWGSVSGCKICVSNPPQGKSIQRDQSGSFFISSPTVGTSNSKTLTNGESSLDTNTGIHEETTSVNKETTNKVVYSETYKVTTEIIKPKIISASVPFYMYSNTKDNKGRILNSGKYVWNFGNGEIKELYSNDKFEYNYDYPGEYFVNLSFYKSKFSDIPDVTYSTVLKVESSVVYISSVSNVGDMYVELSNKNDYDTDLSGWSISSGSNKFSIPKGTILLKSRKLRFSNNILKFDNLKSVLLLNPAGKIVSIYPNTQSIYNKEIKSPLKTEEKINNNIVERNYDNNTELLDLNKLKAEALSSQKENDKVAYLAWFGFLVLICLAVFTFVYMRKKNKNIDSIDGLRDTDINIIE